MEMEQMRDYLIRMDSKMPKGQLRTCHPVGKTTRYYHTGYNENSGDRYDKYISKKKNLELIRKLAQKNYNEVLLQEIDCELELLRKFKIKLKPEKKESIFSYLTEDRKALVTPYYRTAKELYEEFSSEEYEPNTSHPEHLKFETDNGEKVRSKSELMIANQLYRHEKDLCYKYEKPLTLSSGEIIHPDFTIMRKDDAKIFYWEHYGRMDKSNYVDELVWKMDQYAKEDIWPGENLIMTFETEAFPLSLQKIRRTIDKYLLE